MKLGANVVLQMKMYDKLDHSCETVFACIPVFGLKVIGKKNCSLCNTCSMLLFCYSLINIQEVFNQKREELSTPIAAQNTNSGREDEKVNETKHQKEEPQEQGDSPKPELNHQQSNGDDGKVQASNNEQPTNSIGQAPSDEKIMMHEKVAQEEGKVPPKPEENNQQKNYVDDVKLMSNNSEQSTKSTKKASTCNLL